MAKRTFGIIGMSSFGYYLALELARSNHEVMVIDIDEAKVDDIKDYVSKALVADAADRETLQELEFHKLDVVVVSLGTSVETSILATLYLRELGAKEIMVKSITEDQGRIVDKIGADHVIFPERDMAMRTALSLRYPNVLEQISIGGDMQIVEIAVPDSFIDKTLADLDLRKDLEIQVLLIKAKALDRHAVMPTSTRHFKSDDMIVILGTMDAIESFQKKYC